MFPGISSESLPVVVRPARIGRRRPRDFHPTRQLREHFAHTGRLATADARFAQEEIGDDADNRAGVRYRFDGPPGPQSMSLERVRSSVGVGAGVAVFSGLGDDRTAFSFGLSAHSSVLRHFAGSDGRVGLHGTNQPDLIGSSVSHGCIRVHNESMRRLARILPLGTPVFIRT